jgi:hypothetical protein
MSYFHHQYASNSDIKEVVARSENRQKPENIELIYDFGTEFHAGILEPHKADWTKVSPDQKLLIEQMARTFWSDRLCRQIVMMRDFRREHEFYRVGRYGLQGVRCKVDGETRMIRTILELKGLSLTTERAFKESIEHLDYDQGCTWYIDTATGYIRYDHKLIVGISKKEPDRLFKVLVNRDHQFYKSGMEKVKKGVSIWKQNGFV